MTILLCIYFQSTLMYNHFVIVCNFARLSGNILKLCGKYYIHLSGNLVSFLTVEFL